MTNYEKIKSMDVKEMANFLGNAKFNCEYVCDAQDIWYKQHGEQPCCEHCKQAIAEWLESEVGA